MVASTLAFKGSSAVITTGAAGGGATVKLLFTDFTPLIPLAVVSADAFAASSFTSPESVTTPSFTLVETPERLELAAIALSTDVLTSASEVFDLQDINEAIKKKIIKGNASTGLILLFIVDCFEIIKTQSGIGVLVKFSRGIFSIRKN